MFTEEAEKSPERQTLLPKPVTQSRILCDFDLMHSGQSPINNSDDEKKSSEHSLISRMVLSVSYPMEFMKAPPFPPSGVGVWFLEPSQHLIESALLSMIALSFLSSSDWTIATTDTRTATSSSSVLSIFETIIFYLLSIDFVYHSYLKLELGNDLKELFYVLQPCTMIHALLVVIFYNSNGVYNDRLTNLVLTQLYGPIGAVLLPDLDWYQTKLQRFHFWFQHYCIITLPFYLVLKNDILITADLIYQNYFISVLYHFLFLEICCLLFGLNLNYLMRPPPNGPQIKLGIYYRIGTTLLCFVLSFVTGFILPVSVNALFKFLYFP